MKLRPRLRLSLLGLLSLTAGAAIAITAWRRSAERQEIFVEGILDCGGNVAYEWQIDASKHDFKKNAKPLYPKWLVDWIGQHYFHSVFFAQIDLSEDKAADLSFLRFGDSLDELSLIRGDPSGRLDSAFLPNLKRIDVFVDGTLDLSFLTKFDSLETASIDADRIEELSAIKELPQLKTLYLRTNAFKAPESLEKLTQLKRLSITTLDPGHVPPLTAIQLVQIRSALPDCRVAADNTME